MLGACLALALFAIGGAAHLGHHLEDPSCDARPGPESHACASCAGLHAGAIAEAALACLPAGIAWHAVALPAVVEPRACASASDAIPRAPPVA